MEVDLQRLFRLHVHWDSNTRALLVSKDRRHLFVTPCSTSIITLRLLAPAWVRELASAANCGEAESWRPSSHLWRTTTRKRRITELDPAPMMIVSPSPLPSGVSPG